MTAASALIEAALGVGKLCPVFPPPDTMIKRVRHRKASTLCEWQDIAMAQVEADTASVRQSLLAGGG